MIDEEEDPELSPRPPSPGNSSSNGRGEGRDPAADGGDSLPAAGSPAASSREPPAWVPNVQMPGGPRAVSGVAAVTARVASPCWLQLCREEETDRWRTDRWKARMGIRCFPVKVELAGLC